MNDRKEQNTVTKGMFPRRIPVKGLLIAALLVVVMCYVVTAYLSHYYHGTDMAEAALCDTTKVQVVQGDDALYFVPNGEIRCGLVFYPGGKVEYTAYAPLMQELAANGILCALPHLTGNLAVLELNAAENLKEAYPQVESWYIGGHSLGGAAACWYLAYHEEEYTGLILLGSYSMNDLSHIPVKVLSLYGSEDGVMNREKYAKNHVNLPEDFVEYVIDGGNHAYFGNYGEQKGDGTASITWREQQQCTVDYILLFVGAANSQEDAGL